MRWKGGEVKLSSEKFTKVAMPWVELGVAGLSNERVKICRRPTDERLTTFFRARQQQCRDDAIIDHSAAIRGSVENIRDSCSARKNRVSQRGIFSRPTENDRVANVSQLRRATHDDCLHRDRVFGDVVAPYDKTDARVETSSLANTVPILTIRMSRRRRGTCYCFRRCVIGDIRTSRVCRRNWSTSRCLWTRSISPRRTRLTRFEFRRFRVYGQNRPFSDGMLNNSIQIRVWSRLNTRRHVYSCDVSSRPNNCHHRPNEYNIFISISVCY